MSNYRVANTTTQWFQDDYPGATMNLTERTAVVVLHTTEGSSWPGYDGGAIAPNYTARPNFALQCLEWRAHYPDEKSSRALQNLAGGVETNTLNAVQVELVGTCDPAHRESWAGVGKAGVDYLYWPDAPGWALLGVARFLADQHKRHGLVLDAPDFLPYPASINGARFSFDRWRKFVGVCGHQHVPENVHGDPGDIPIQQILNMAKQIASPPSLRVVVTEKPSLGHDADMVMGARHLTRGRVRDLGAGATRTFRWTKASWFKHRFCFISWTELATRSQRREVRQFAKQAKEEGFDLVLAGPRGDTKVFTPERLCQRLGLNSRTANGLTFAWPEAIDLGDAFPRDSAVVFELEKPK